MEREAGRVSYEFGEWRVEPSLNRVVRNGRAVHVEPRTLSVLACLLDRPGQLVSMDELLDVVWPGQIVEPNVIHRHVARIRHALRDDAHDPTYIETIAKRGYRAVAPVSRRNNLWAEEATALPAASAGRDEKTSTTTTRPAGSLAVLPLVNLSPDPDHAFFAAGLHEELLNQLGKVSGLSVIARTTMMRYTNTALSIPEIADELKVQAVVEGSVRYAGDRVRITAQLVDARSGAQLWSEAYEEALRDVFRVQLAIAERIAQSLDASICRSEWDRAAARRTLNPEAYTHYLRAISSWGSFAGAAPVHAALEEAIAADPGFAPALAYQS